MAIKDIVTNLISLLAMFANVVGNGATAGAIIDTANFELGLMLSVAVGNYTDGSYLITIKESDDSGMAGATDIPSDNIIGGLPAALTADTASGGSLSKFGVFGNKRYIQVTVTASAVTVGADITVIATQKAETAPV